MKLYWEVLKLLCKKYILRRPTGVVIRDFCQRMGIVYIKLAQILATQNYGNIFTEADRVALSSICDDCNPISFGKIKVSLRESYDRPLAEIFESIDKKPIGAASISQVHRAVLKSGETVAVKVKRKDVTRTVEKDIETIRKIIKRFGKFANLKNFIGGDKALDMYLRWIYEEVDFAHEKNNIEAYNEFTRSVNGKVAGTKRVLPLKVYESLCTDQIIVMEYVEHKTLNKLVLDAKSRDTLKRAVDSYFRLSFYALFNKGNIVFHGDPHTGNIYLDEAGNIGFLDMGLLFVLSDEDAQMARRFFLAAYAGNYQKMVEMLLRYGDLNVDEKTKFTEETKAYCEKIRYMPVTSFFTELMAVCVGYQIAPPDFLFCMAKAFVCLSGIGKFSDDVTGANTLLGEQVVEYCLRRTVSDGAEVLAESARAMPQILSSVLRHGPISGISKEVRNIENVHGKLRGALENYEEMLAVFGGVGR